jgi:hypothetical protein
MTNRGSLNRSIFCKRVIGYLFSSSETGLEVPILVSQVLLESCFGRHLSRFPSSASDVPVYAKEDVKLISIGTVPDS